MPPRTHSLAHILLIAPNPGRPDLWVCFAFLGVLIGYCGPHPGLASVGFNTASGPFSPGPIRETLKNCQNILFQGWLIRVPIPSQIMPGDILLIGFLCI